MKPAALPLPDTGERQYGHHHEKERCGAHLYGDHDHGHTSFSETDPLWLRYQHRTSSPQTLLKGGGLFGFSFAFNRHSGCHRLRIPVPIGRTRRVCQAIYPPRRHSMRKCGDILLAIITLLKAFCLRMLKLGASPWPSQEKTAVGVQNRVAICCFPNCAYLSETSRMIAVYKRLIANGERAIMATHGGTYESVLKAEGIRFDYVPPIMTHEQAQAFVAANRSDAGWRTALRFYRTDELREHVRAELAFFREKQISVVLTGWTLSTAISARAAGIPLAVSHMGSYVPPVLGKTGIPIPGLSPALERRLLRFISESWLNRFYNWSLGLPFWSKPYNIVARELGIAPFTGFMDQLLGDVTLVTDTPEILGMSRADLESWRPGNPRAYSRQSRLKYVGAIYAQLFGDVPDDVRAFLDTDKPKVFVALTSSTPAYVAGVYSLLQEMEDVKAVFVSTIHDTNFEKLSHIMVKRHLPSHRVMPLVDLAIIHGGQGSVQTAIASGVPVIGFPLQGEQLFNLKLIERHGAGRCLSLGAARKGNFGRIVKEILGDGSFRTNMQRLKSHQDRYDGAENAARVLHELLVDHQRQPP